MTSKSLSPGITIATVAATVVLACVIEISAINAKERQELAPRHIDRAYCMRCHQGNERSIMMMQLKEGSCPFIFTSAEKRGVEARLAAYAKAHPSSVHAMTYNKSRASSAAKTNTPNY